MSLDTIRHSWWRLPEFIRFNLSGWIGVILFQQLNSAIYYSLDGFEHEYKSAVVFGVGYFISCLWQHALHRYLVFGATQPYLTSLFAFYATYAISIAASPVVNGVLTAGIGLSMEVAYWISLGAIGLLNYFTAGAVMRQKNKKEVGAGTVMVENNEYETNAVDKQN